MPRDEDDWDAKDYEDEISEVSDSQDRMREEEEEECAWLEELTGDPHAELDSEERGELIAHLLSEEEYQEFLEEYQTPQPEKKPSGKDYEAVCWRPHHEKLTDRTHHRCRKCGWLSCNCGACWCNMPLEKKAKFAVRIEEIPCAIRCVVCKGKPVQLIQGDYKSCETCEGKGYTRQLDDEKDIPF